jgi:CheY-like chemotaxis protein
MTNQTIVLLVDDRPENLITLEGVLQEEHRHFLSATSGHEAMLMTALEKIDLILLDYRLDDMTGIEVIRELRKRDETKHIPVILVTALSIRECPSLDEFEAGTVGLIHKPLDILKAIKTVEDFEERFVLKKV